MEKKNKYLQSHLAEENIFNFLENNTICFFLLLFFTENVNKKKTVKLTKYLNRQFVLYIKIYIKKTLI